MSLTDDELLATTATPPPPSVARGLTDEEVMRAAPQVAPVQAPRPQPPQPQVAPSDGTEPGVLEETWNTLKSGLSSFNTASLIAQHSTGIGGVDVPALAQSLYEESQAKYPKSASVAEGEKELEAIKEEGWRGLASAAGTYATHPRMTLQTVAQSLPSMIPSVATVPLGGLLGLPGGPTGVAAGARAGYGVGSALGDYGDAYKDYVRDVIKPQTAADWELALKDPKIHGEARNYALAHAGVVGALDMLGMKVSGRVGEKIIGERIKSPLGSVLAKGVAGAPAGATVGAFGEAGGELAGQAVTGQPFKIDPGAVTGEFAAGLVTDVASSAVEPALKTFEVGADRGPRITDEKIKDAADKGELAGLGIPPAAEGPLPPPPGAPASTMVGQDRYIVGTDPTKPAGTVPTTLVPTGEDGVITSVAIRPGRGLVSQVPLVTPTEVPDSLTNAEYLGKNAQGDDVFRRENGKRVVVHPPGTPIRYTMEANVFKPSLEGGYEAVADPKSPFNVVKPSQAAVAVQGQMGVPTPVEGLYSRLYSWVEEKGPAKATGERWTALVRRGDFSQEEARDMGLNTLLESVGPKEVLRREDVLSYLDMNAITLHEVIRRPLDPLLRQQALREGQERIGELMRTDPTASRGYGVVNRNHPGIRQIEEVMGAINDDANWTKYEKYTTAGPRDAYVELTLSTPNRLSLNVRAYEPRGEVVHDPLGDPRQPWQMIVEGVEIDRYADERRARLDLGRELEGRKKLATIKNREFVGGHYRVPGEIVTLRATIRRTIDGQPIAVLEEVQGDIHQRGKKVGYGISHPISGFVPDLPMKENWASLAFTRFVMWAAENDIRHVTWANAEEQMVRYDTGTEGEIQRRRRGMQAFYDKQILGVAKRFARRVGGTMGYETIAGRQYEVHSLSGADESTVPRGWADTGPTGDWGVFDLTRSNPTPVAVTTSEADAQAYIARNTAAEPTRFRSMIIPQTGMTYIQAGMPTYAKMDLAVPDEVPMTASADVWDVITKKQVAPLVKALETLIKQLKIAAPVKIRLFRQTLTIENVHKDGPKAGETYQQPKPTWLGVMQGPFADGRFEIGVAVGQHRTLERVWATMTHELGHLIELTTYQTAPRSVREAVDAAYHKFLEGLRPTTTMRELYTRRYNAAEMMATNTSYWNSPIKNFAPNQQEYWAAKAEWFAENVARYMTTREKPLSVVEKFFAGIAKQLLTLFREAKKLFNAPFEPVKELQEWLDTQLVGMPEMLKDIQAETENEGTVENAIQMGEEELPAPTQVETSTAGDGIDKLFNGNSPPEAKQTKSYADKFNWLYKWFTGVHQLSDANPHIASLAEYVETLDIAHITKQQIMIRAQEVLKRWNRLGETQADAVSKLLDEVQYMMYRTPDEIKRGVSRQPTLAEVQAIAKKHGVTEAGFATFVEITKTFQEHLQRVEGMLRAEAAKITNLFQRDLENVKIDKQMKNLRSQPYFPAMRFGNYAITIRNAAGKVIHFETFERSWRRNRAVQAIKAKYGVKDEDIQLGYIDKESRPLLGVPTQLLERMGTKLKLSKTQRDLLEQLKFEMSPAQSFQHRFQHKTFTPGYSQDFRRAYATYFFHGANHIVKALYADRLRALIGQTEAETKTQYHVDKRDKIVIYMNDHVEHWLDPKSDWAMIRSIAFMWALAFVPSAAAQNLTQTIMTSYPFLASKFGDASAISALMAAGREFQTFYSKGRLANQSNFQQRALFNGMEQGIIKETQAPELAGYADGNVLGTGFGGNELQRFFVKFNELGAGMFEMAEQVNRRLIFRAALDLALKNPNAAFVRESVEKRKLLYDQSRADMTEAEAAAYVTAVNATVTTQFRYGREFAPRVMRGKARSLFVFKTFIQSYVVFLANNPQAAIRSLLILGFLGGLMGVPFADDLRGIVQAIAYRMFGKDYDLEKEGRRLVLQLLGEDENGRQTAELVMHGVARKGFGIPALMDMLAGTVGVDFKMPVFDRSAAISAGTILPVEFGKLFGPPTASSESVIAAQTQKASGAVFGIGFNAYKALMNHKLDWDEAKRWERVLPRVLANGSKFNRVWSKGAETRSDESKLVEYDVRDNQQMAEVIGMAMGYTPYRQTLERERDQAIYDAAKLWDIRRQDLMNHFGNAVLGRDAAEISKVRDAVRNFNHELPPEARGKAITSEGLEKSVEQKAQNRAMRERGLPPKLSDVPIAREVGKLYPESQRKIKPVPKALTP